LNIGTPNSYTICFKDNPSLCVRQNSYILYAQPSDGSDSYKQDASFIKFAGISGEMSTVSFQSVRFADRYIINRDGNLVIAPDDTTLTFKYSASYFLTNDELEQEQPVPIPVIRLFMGPDMLSWDSAQKYCVSLVGRLVVIDTPERNNEALKICGKDCGWIGLKCDQTTGCNSNDIWFWMKPPAVKLKRIDQGFKVSWEPDSNNNCGYWVKPGVWGSAKCNALKRPVCEKYFGFEEPPKGPALAQFSQSYFGIPHQWLIHSKLKFTLDAWILPLDLSGVKALFSDDDWSKGNVRLLLNAGKVEFHLNSNQPEIAAFDKQLLSSEWYHVAVSYACDDQHKFVTLFIDGIAVQRTRYIACGPWQPQLANLTSSIGNSHSDNQSFIGFMSHFRIWNIDLEEADVQKSAAISRLPLDMMNLDLSLGFQCYANDTGPNNVSVSMSSITFERPPITAPNSLLNNGAFIFGSTAPCFEYVSNLPGWRTRGGVVMIYPGCTAWTDLQTTSADYFLGLQMAGTFIEQIVEVGSQNYTFMLIHLYRRLIMCFNMMCVP
jgi:hypothetical protein